MAIGTGTVKLTDIINEFGGQTSTPLNLRSYLKCGNFVGWDGGVANHENNANVPFSGTIKLSDFRSVGAFTVDKDFTTDTYTGQLNDYYDTSEAYFWESKSGLYTSNASISFGLVFSNYPAGSVGTIDVIGKSTYDATPGHTETATIDSIFDWTLGQTGPVPDNAVLFLKGDQRITGWGSPWFTASVTINLTTTTLLRTNSLVPNGSYDATYDLTYWVWPTGTIFGFVNGSYSPYNFTATIANVVANPAPIA